jgi:hypothetical protein
MFWVRLIVPANNNGQLTFEFRIGSSWAAGTVIGTFQPPAGGASPTLVDTEWDITDLGLAGAQKVYFNVTGSLDPTYAEAAFTQCGFYSDERYNDTGEYGRHGDLTGRRVTLKSIQNERINDGKISYDVYENIKTADINTDDAWFFIGATEALNREKETFITDIIDAGISGAGSGLLWGSNASLSTHSPLKWALLDSASTKPSDADAAGNEDGIVQLSEVQDMGYSTATPTLANSQPAILRLQRCTKRRKVVIRERKYFVRRPTVEDLANTLDGEIIGVALSDAMDRVKSVTNNGVEPDGNLAITYDVLRLGAYNFAVERTTVAIATEVYRDDDAFDKFIDSNGDPAFGVQFAVLHTNVTSPMKPMMPDESEA